MLNTAAAYILVLIFVNDYRPGRAGGLSMQEFPNFASCKAAVEQLKVDARLTGYCIAKEVR